MTDFSIVSAVISLVLLVGFVVLSVIKFGWRHSYSAFNICWDEVVPIHNMHLWSIVTFVVAFLIMPALIEKGVDNPLQFSVTKNGAWEKAAYNMLASDYVAVSLEFTEGQLNTEVLYFNCGGYVKGTTPLFKEGDHYFSK